MSFCMVCGASLIGAEWLRHFGANQICPSCGVFFARSMGKKLICDRTENCELFKKVAQLAGTPIHQFARTACRACRMQKCKQIGMREQFARKAPMVFAKNRKKSVKSAFIDENKHIAKIVSHQTNIVEDFVLKIEPRFSDQFNDLSILLSSLVQAETKIRLLYNEQQIFKEGFLEKFATMAELYAFDALHKFREPNPWDNAKYFNFISTHGAFALQPYRLITDIVANIELFRTMPIAAKLSPEERVILLNYVGMPLAMLNFNYRSAKCRAETICYPSDGYSSLFVMQNAKVYAGHHGLQNLADYLFRRTMEPFNRIQLKEEEFYLLRSIIFCHDACPGLSLHAQEFLRAEAARYSQSLFRWLKLQFGTEALYVRRFADIINLAACVFRSGARYSELITYMAIVSEQGRFHARMPPALVPLCLDA